MFDADNADPTLYRAASYYSYDIHGNVDTLLQDYGRTSIMGTTSNRFKLIRYDFDLISGKVNQVSYQPGQMDAFYHQYSYDAENRLTAVRTSTDSLNWQSDASYTYYRHGPLARTQLGDLQVEGVDYAYSLQGWLKAINPSWITDPSTGDQYDQDGTGSPALFARDAYKLNLNYFDDGTYTDYKPIAPPTGYVQGNGIPSAQKTNLYNGNIGSQALNIRKLAAGTAAYAGPLIYNYHYDQLNRIGSMDAWAANGSFTPTGTSAMPDYAERFGYDPNGNILTLSRNGTTGTGLALGMDNLSYQYIYAKSAGGVGEYVPGQAPTTGVDHLTNQLASIRDAVTSSGYNDIKNQSALNYQYDAIGNLIADAQAQITNITWSVYGKILSITDSGKTISYTYDPSGNRISKTANGISTWYVRDASGNVMSVYAQGDNSHNGGAITQTEAHVYGSSRLGILNLNVNCTSLGLTYPLQNTLVRGGKLFELTNHLGNVLVTISDKKLQHSSDNSTVDYYNPDVITAGDYYAFGMPMPGRTYNNANYRYGFNGKEQDNEVKGTANEVDYGMRVYDPRVGRFLSVDPIGTNFPWNSPYSYAENDPINSIDLDGAEKSGPKSVEIAQHLLNIVGLEVLQTKNLLSTETHRSVKARLLKALEIEKTTYAALAVFIYKNKMTDHELALYYALKSGPIAEQVLDLSPAGDIKVVITGSNFESQSKSRLGAVGFLALDVFGGEILGALGKSSRIIKRLSGPGKEIIESVIEKTTNISSALDELHVRAAVNDILGNPVIINGKAYDHLKEVRNALTGLGNQISKLDKLIKEGKASEEVISAASDLRSRLQIQKDAINDVLNRAAKKVGN